VSVTSSLFCLNWVYIVFFLDKSLLILFSDRSSTGKAKTLKSRYYININFIMKKKKITGLSLRKRTVSSLEVSSLSGGTGSYYNCWTFAPPCVSATEPPEDPTYICFPPPGGTTDPNPTGTCNSCFPCDTGGPSGPSNPTQ